MSKHTPGPWVVNSLTRRANGGNYYWWIATEEGRDADTVATVAVSPIHDDPSNDEVAAANARLIAAAPQLLEALQNLLAVCREELDEKRTPEMAEARAALALVQP